MTLSLKDIPSLGWRERRALTKEGWQVVHRQHPTTVVTLFDEPAGTFERFYSPAMKAAIAQYGGTENVKIIGCNNLLAPVPVPGGVSTSITFYVLGKPRTTVFM